MARRETWALLVLLTVLSLVSLLTHLPASGAHGHARAAAERGFGGEVARCISRLYDEPGTVADLQTREDRALLTVRPGRRRHWMAAETAAWTAAVRAGLFRYDPEPPRMRAVPGVRGYVVRWSPLRFQRKRTSVDAKDGEAAPVEVVRPVSETQFTFLKARSWEVVFAFDRSVDRSAPADDSFHICLPGRTGRHLVLINTSPMEHPHLILVPNAAALTGQVLDAAAIHLALDFANAYPVAWGRVVYSSLGATASVNHQHFQVFEAEAGHPMAIESAALDERQLEGSPVRVFLPVQGEYPIPFLALRSSFNTEGARDRLGAATSRVVTALQDRNQPFNLLIADQGRMVYIVPRRPMTAAAAETDAIAGVDTVGIWEISGRLTVARRAAFETLTEDAVDRMLAAVAVPRSDVEGLVGLAVGASSDL